MSRSMMTLPTAADPASVVDTDAYPFGDSDCYPWILAARADLLDEEFFHPAPEDRKSVV